jgi:hypothetical protein
MISNQFVEDYTLYGYFFIAIFLALDLGITSGMILTGASVEINPMLIDGFPSPFVNQWIVIARLAFTKIIACILIVAYIEIIKYFGDYFGI